MKTLLEILDLEGEPDIISEIIDKGNLQNAPIGAMEAWGIFSKPKFGYVQSPIVHNGLEVAVQLWA